MSYDNETIREPRCPKCGGLMWNNITTKRNPKAPDFKCKDKQCDGAVWPEKNGNGSAPRAATPAPAQQRQAYNAGPRIPEMDGPVDIPKLDALFSLYSACLDHVLAVEVPKLDAAKIGASPESVGAMTATLLIQAAKIG